MRRTEQRQGLRMLKLRDVLSRWEADKLSQLEAAELLGMSERTFRRWIRRFEEEGEAGLADRRLGRRSGRAVPAAEADQVARLYRERYDGFTVKHFHERLQRSHGFRWGLHLDQNVPAKPRAGRDGAAARRAPAQAAAPADDRHDAASGRLARGMAGRPRAARPGDHDG
jgi:transposase